MEVKQQKNIVLINPPSSTVIPIGLEIIANYFDSKKEVHEKLRDYTISIIDGTGITKEEIIRIFMSMDEPEYVGISSWQSNHRLAMNILDEIKRELKNSKFKTIVGGPNCFYNYRQIMNNNSSVDFIVRGPGELTLVDLVLGEDLHDIPNLVYRENGEIKTSSRQEVIDMSLRPIFNLEHIVNKRKYANNNELVGFPLSNIFGCFQSTKAKKRCSFCSLPSLVTKVNSPGKFWKQVDYLYKTYGISNFFETGDSFIIGRYPELILKSKPNDLNVVFRVYASPDQLSYEVLETLKKIGVNFVFIGVENINPKIQSNFHKKFNEETIEIILKDMKKLGMKALMGYMYGLPGETKQTISNSTNFLKSLVEKYKDNIGLILNNIVVPIMGSDLYSSIIRNEKINIAYSSLTNESLSESDNINYELLQRLMIEIGDFDFTYEELQQEVANINNYISEFVPTFEWKKDN